MRAPWVRELPTHKVAPRPLRSRWGLWEEKPQKSRHWLAQNWCVSLLRELDSQIKVTFVPHCKAVAIGLRVVICMKRRFQHNSSSLDLNLKAKKQYFWIGLNWSSKRWRQQISKISETDAIFRIYMALLFADRRILSFTTGNTAMWREVREDLLGDPSHCQSQEGWETLCPLSHVSEEKVP